MHLLGREGLTKGTHHLKKPSVSEGSRKAATRMEKTYINKMIRQREVEHCTSVSQKSRKKEEEDLRFTDWTGLDWERKGVKGEWGSNLPSNRC